MCKTKPETLNDLERVRSEMHLDSEDRDFFDEDGSENHSPNTVLQATQLGQEEDKANSLNPSM